MKKTEMDLIISELILKYENDLKDETQEDICCSPSLSYFSGYLKALKDIQKLIYTN